MCVPIPVSPFHSEQNEDMDGMKSVSPDTKACLLLDNVLHTLTKCFTFDRGGGFLTRDRFDALMQPLVDQVCPATISQVDRVSFRG